MRCNRTLNTLLTLLSLLLLSSTISAQCPKSFQIDGVPRIKQLRNYCGPATLAAVLQCFGENTTQERIGKAVYNPIAGTTNGADMLFYARSEGYAAYSWNSSIADAKRKLAAGAPIIVLQQNSTSDPSGHYRVLTGYNDATSTFSVMDPYYDLITELSYAQCEKLWKPMGLWALLVVPTAKDTFAAHLNDDNPVVHMDMSYAMFTRGNYPEALREAKIALEMEPYNDYSLSMLSKITKAMGAGKKRG